MDDGAPAAGHPEWLITAFNSDENGYAEKFLVCDLVPTVEAAV